MGRPQGRSFHSCLMLWKRHKVHHSLRYLGAFVVCLPFPTTRVCLSTVLLEHLSWTTICSRGQDQPQERSTRALLSEKVHARPVGRTRGTRRCAPQVPLREGAHGPAGRSIRGQQPPAAATSKVLFCFQAEVMLFLGADLGR